MVTNYFNIVLVGKVFKVGFVIKGKRLDFCTKIVHVWVLI